MNRSSFSLNMPNLDSSTSSVVVRGVGIRGVLLTQSGQARGACVLSPHPNRDKHKTETREGSCSSK